MPPPRIDALAGGRTRCRRTVRGAQLSHYVAVMDRPGWLYYVAAALFVIAGLIMAIAGDQRVIGIFMVVVGVLFFVYARLYAKR
jgi:drug/metabolite transporter (DMT)-like permease